MTDRRGGNRSGDVSPRDLYEMWVVTREMLRRSRVTSVEGLLDSFPKAKSVQIQRTINACRRYGLVDAKKLELTDLGNSFASADQPRLWSPPTSFVEALGASRRFFIDQPHRPKVIDLFSGAGGLGLGFEMAGFEIAAAVENDPQAAEAHRINFPNSAVLEADIVQLAKNLRKELSLAGVNPGDIDGVIGGPPCQGFSYMGERSQSDERNLLTSRFVDVVETLKPKFFCMENVPGLLTSGQSPDFLTFMIRQSKAIGEPASNIVSKLPTVRVDIAKRSRQFLRRMVSRTIEEVRASATDSHEFEDTPTPRSASVEVRRILRKLERTLRDEIKEIYVGESLKEALAQVGNCRDELMVISCGMFLDLLNNDGVIGKRDARSFVDGLLRVQDMPAVSGLISAYDSIPPGGTYRGVRVGPIAMNLIKRLSRNYVVSAPVVLNAAEYGAPQERKRAFIVGVRRDLGKEIVLRPKTHESNKPTQTFSDLPNAPTSSDAIGDLPDVDLLPELMDGDSFNVEYLAEPTSNFAALMRLDEIDALDMSLIRPNWNPFVVENSKRTNHDDAAKRRIAATPHGKQEGTSGRTRLHPDRGSHTLRAGTREGKGSHTAVRPLHYEHLRVISVREGARLMGYPDWMTFHPTKWHGFRLVGNGVPAQLGRHVAASIMDSIYSSGTTHRK